MEAFSTVHARIQTHVLEWALISWCCFVGFRASADLVKMDAYKLTSDV